MAVCFDRRLIGSAIGEVVQATYSGLDKGRIHHCDLAFLRSPREMLKGLVNDLIHSFLNVFRASLP